MLRMPVNEVMAGQSAGLIGSGPVGAKGPGQVTRSPAALREDDAFKSIHLESPLR